MKRHSLTIAIAAGLTAAGTAAYADNSWLRMSDLIRHERMSPQEAAATIVIAQGLNADTGLILSTKRSMRTQVWNLGPVVHLSQRLHRHPLDIKELRDRGWTWDEIERNIPRGRYDDRRDRYDYRDPFGRRVNDLSSWEGRREFFGHVLEGLLGGRPGNQRGTSYRDQGMHRYDRRRAQELDRAYERRLWENILSRTVGRGGSTAVRWTDHGRHYGDLSVAAYIARLARADINYVMQIAERNRMNWNRTRDDFGISSDWETFRYDPRPGGYDPRRGQQYDPRRDDLSRNPWHDWRGPWGLGR